MNKLMENVSNNENVLIMGDFNAHNVLWGSEKTDKNGEVIEHFLNKNSLIILNNGERTRLDPRTGKTSCLDLSITSPSLACKSTWGVMRSTFGSDHFPISLQVSLEKSISLQCLSKKGPHRGNAGMPNGNVVEKPFSFKNINWSNFAKKCEEVLNGQITLKNTNVKEMYTQFMEYLKEVIKEAVPQKSKKKQNPVPWWTKECSAKIKERNKASNKLSKGRMITLENIDDYCNKKTMAQRVLRQAEQKYWQAFCTKLDRYMPESKIWTCIKRLNGVPGARSNFFSSLTENDQEITREDEKVHVFVHYFQSLGMREDRVNEQYLALVKNSMNIQESVINEPFLLIELEKAVQ